MRWLVGLRALAPPAWVGYPLFGGSEEAKRARSAAVVTRFPAAASAAAELQDADFILWEEFSRDYLISQKAGNFQFSVNCMTSSFISNEAGARREMAARQSWAQDVHAVQRRTRNVVPISGTCFCFCK